MALNQHSLQLLNHCKPKSVLSLGFPDIVVSRQELREITGIDVEGGSIDQQKWHGTKESLPDTMEFFAKLGCEFTCVDYKVIRGNEVVADLNFPHSFGEFDLVIDPGTIEHCFNIATAVINAAQSVKVGGHIVHVNPVTMVNHGFYNLCPTFYYDFYLENGFEIVEAFAALEEMKGAFPHKGRVGYAPEVSAYVLARRLEAKPFKFPIQAKYARSQG